MNWEKRFSIRGNEMKPLEILTIPQNVYFGQKTLKIYISSVCI